MTTLHKTAEPVRAVQVRFVDSTLYVSLNNKREISLPLRHIPWLQWLARATPEQRAKWSIEPRGFAVYWDDLDDGIEVSHLLEMQSTAAQGG